MPGTGVAFIAMAILVGRAGATGGAVAIYFLPVVALVLGVTIRGETLPMVSVAGVGLVLLGAWVTSRGSASGWPSPRRPRLSHRRVVATPGEIPHR